MTDSATRFRDATPGIARALAARRRQLGLSLAEVETRAGVSRMTCWRAETLGAVTLGNAVRLAAALGVSLTITPDGCTVTPARRHRSTAA